MGKSKEYKETEQFAIEEEERENQWQRKYGEKLPEVIEKMNLLLQEGTKESREKLRCMFLNKSFFEQYKQTDDVATMYVVMQIYEREQNSGITAGILEQGRDVEQLMRYVQTLKFILYRVDFRIDTGAGEELLTFIRQHNVSTIVLETMLTTVAMRPLLLTLKLEKLFEQNLMYKELFFVYSFLNQRYPGNYRILQRQAELYLRTGYREEAKACLMQIPDYPREICGEQQEVLALQEELWKLRYMQKDVCEGIVGTIKARQMSEAAWKVFLQNEPAQAAEYLLLAEAMLNEGMQQIAWETLIFADKVLAGNEMILCLLADLCVNRREFNQAVEFLKKIEKPSDMACKFLTMCQEKMI